MAYTTNLKTWFFDTISFAVVDFYLKYSNRNSENDREKYKINILPLPPTPRKTTIADY